MYMYEILTSYSFVRWGGGFAVWAGIGEVLSGVRTSTRSVFHLLHTPLYISSTKKKMLQYTCSPYREFKNILAAGTRCFVSSTPNTSCTGQYCMSVTLTAAWTAPVGTSTAIAAKTAMGVCGPACPWLQSTHTQANKTWPRAIRAQ